MRVLHLSSGNMYGGIESMLVTLANCRAHCPEMRPSVALAFEGRLSRELRDTGIPVTILGPVRASRPYSVLRARRRLRTLLDRGAYDVAICHAPWSHAVFAQAVRQTGTPLVFWAHGEATGEHWLERWAALTPPALAICNSAFTADSVPAIFPYLGRTVLYPPVANAVISPAARTSTRRQLQTPPDATVFLQVSRLEPWKGQHLLLDALEHLPRESAWICWIAGYPQSDAERLYAEQLHDRARRLGVLDRVRFHQTTHSVRELFAAADVYCQANTGPEPFGITFAEAMLSGLPVVTTALGGPRDFVDDSCGIVVPPNDATALAAALGRLARDAAARASLGRCGADRARELFDPAGQIERLNAVLSGLVATQVVH